MRAKLPLPVRDARSSGECEVMVSVAPKMPALTLASPRSCQRTSEGL